MIKGVVINKKYESYLKDRWLLQQYKKAVNLFLLWNLLAIDFKLRKPKKDWIFQFKINKQFRALWEVKWSTFFVKSISNHQD
jgi:hypothetical protein